MKKCSSCVIVIGIGAIILSTSISVQSAVAASNYLKFARAIVRSPFWAVPYHNLYRARHCAPDASYSADLARGAQEWANQCQYRHSNFLGVGENLYYSGPAGTGNDNFRAAVGYWYNEGQFYNFNMPGLSQQTGHFTQVIWKASTSIGCGRAVCPGSNFPNVPPSMNVGFWVCRYSPQGNIFGQFGANVLATTCK
jgi:hypothetical protein